MRLESSATQLYEPQILIYCYVDVLSAGGVFFLSKLSISNISQE
jgi:hypothetical protein